MFICKMGYDHMFGGMNCHDSGYIQGTGLDEVKCVADGCSGGLHSEVGSKLYCDLRQSGVSLEDTFERILAMWKGTVRNMYSVIDDYLCFTILEVSQTETDFKVLLWGDGYIITETHEGVIEYIRFDVGDEPPYYVYKYVKPEVLANYKDGVKCTELVFPKEKFKNVGVATDGIRYLLKDNAIRAELDDLLVRRKESAIKRLINKNYPTCKDDICIAF